MQSVTNSHFHANNQRLNINEPVTCNSFTQALKYFCCGFNDDSAEDTDYVAMPVEQQTVEIAKVQSISMQIIGNKKDEEVIRPLNEMVKRELPVIISAKDIVDAIKGVNPIAKEFTTMHSIESQRISHQEAKAYLKKYLTAIDADVAFISPPPLKNPMSVKKIQISPLSKEVFFWENTHGVAGDIQKDGKRIEDTIIMYGVASQFNGCEACGPYTIPPGNAVHRYKGDLTQGPQAQLQFHPHQVELINCAGNKGFNGLINMLDEETKSSVMHGYFMPNEKDADAVIQALSTTTEVEYICVANRPYDERFKKMEDQQVHMTLLSAPAFGYGGLRNGAKRNQIEFLCALQGFRAQFQHCIHLAKSERKPVIFKAAGMGLGVYGNDELNVAKGFYAAAKEFESQLKENDVTVRFQVFRNTGRAKHMANILGLPQYFA